MKCLGVLVVGMLAAGPLSVRAATLRVPSDYATINDALAQASVGDTVFVAPGTYSDTGGIPAAVAVLVDGVALIGEGGADATILDLKQVPWGTLAFFGASLAAGPTVVEGFTVQGPKPAPGSGAYFQDCIGVTIKECKFRDFDQASYGGAIRALTCSSFEVVDTEFDTCWAPGGGAMFWSNVSGLVDRCVFLDCHSAIQVESVSTLRRETVEIRACVFERATNRIAGGGALSLFGPEPYQSILVEGCAFVDNWGYTSGGAMVSGVTHPTPVSIIGNAFVRCSLAFSGGWGGGAVAIGGGVNVVANNTFIECSVGLGSALLGSAVLTLAAPAQLDNNIFWNCTGAAAVENTGNPAGIVPSCNVFWGNPDGDAAGFQLSSSDRVVDPLFCDPSTDDFTLSSDSPCLPANSLGCGQIGALGEGCGPVSIEDRSWGQVKGAYR